MRRAVAVLVVSLLGVAAASAVAGAQSSGEARRDAERILGRDDGNGNGDGTGNGGRGGNGGGSGGGSSGSGGGGSGRATPVPRSVASPDIGLGALPTILLVVVGAALVALIAWVLVQYLRNRSPRERDTDDDDEVSDLGLSADDDEHVRSSGPDELDRLAGEAEAAGDYSRAYRYRFRAGLLRLDAAGAVRLDPSRTTGQLRRDLARARFDGLASRFDEIVYGDERADATDASHARADWPRLLAEVG